jgi:hypothetical protein
MRLRHGSKARRALALSLLGMLLSPIQGDAEPLAFYLTCWLNPHDTMVVHWHTPIDQIEGKLEVRPVGKSAWKAVDGQRRPWTPARRSVFVAKLDQLEAGQRYECRVAGDETIYTFRTSNDPSRNTVRFAVGGDMRCEWRPSRFREMCEAVAAFDPDFVVAGGDLAYCRGSVGAWPRWDQWLKEWNQLMRTSRGDLIPILPVIGNHEVAGGYGQDATKAPHFFTVFELPEHQPIRTFDIGNVCSLFLLDSGHVNPVEGEQTKWLQAALSARRSRAFRAAVYHVPGVPAVKADQVVSGAVGQHWIPLFDKEDLDCAFEHHRHTMKRSRPLKNGVPHPRGTIYFGDGCWGVPPRAPLANVKAEIFPYYESRNGVWLVDLSAKRMLVRAIDKQGQERDRINLIPRSKLF